MTTKKPKRGRPPLGHTAELSVRMSRVMATTAASMAKRAGVSVSEYVRQALRARMARDLVRAMGKLAKGGK